MRHLQTSLSDSGLAKTKRIWAIWAKKRLGKAQRERGITIKINVLGVAWTAAPGLARCRSGAGSGGKQTG
jgi:hypothetical protein